MHRPREILFRDRGVSELSTCVRCDTTISSPTFEHNCGTIHLMIIYRTYFYIHIVTSLVGLSLGKIGIGYLLQKVLVLCYTHQVKLEPKFVSVMVALGVVEGLGKRLDPDVDVLKRAAPYVFKAALFA